MKVYFGAAITLSRKLLPQYQKIVEIIKKQGHRVLSEYVVDPKLKIGDGLSPEDLFARETETIEKADVMIAEVTTASWGTPLLMSHALNHGKPVLALFYKDAKQKIPIMIKGHPELYSESYDEDNIRLLLKKYFKHFANMIKRKGKLIVIDGGDGSGKETQAKLLLAKLREMEIAVRYFDFPRYYTSFHGKMVGRFLKGDFGDLNKVSPYLASLAYALDRASVRDEIEEWLLREGVVMCNRYVSSNIAHQGARVPKRGRKKFLDWIDELEYRVHKMPREDLVIFLHVPWKVGMELTKKKAKKRRYVKGVDIAEADVKHRKAAEKMYLDLAKNRRKWVKIDCCQDDKILPKKVIHDKILKVLKRRKIIEP